MATSSSKSIALPPDLYSAVQRFAEATHLPVSTIAEKALRSYIDEDPELQKLREFHRAQAAAMGLTTEEYVVELIHQDRAERRRLNQ